VLIICGQYQHFQNHPRLVCGGDEDATVELKVKTVRYFKGLLSVHSQLIEESC
jgi:glucosamine-6-phosphate deaminase